MRAIVPPMYRCSFPGCPCPVSIQISLIETLEGVVRTGGADQQGLLYGQAAGAGNGTIVEGSQALSGFGVDEMRQALAEARATVVGYYRVREGVSLELTPQEMEVAVSLFGRPGSVVLLIERRAGSPAANFFFAEHGAFLNVPLLEFPLDAAALNQQEAQRLTRTNGRTAAQVSNVLPAPGNFSAMTPAGRAEGLGRPGRPWALVWMLGMVILVAAASFSAALLIFRPPARASNESAASTGMLVARSSLRAERQGDDLKILWDLHSPAVAEATSGVLDILDGSASRRILMTADQVRFGSLLYSPASDQISVRLTTLKNDQSTEQESVLVLLKRPPQPDASAAKRQERPRASFEVKTQPLPKAPSAGSPAGANAGNSLAEFRDFPPLPAPQAHVELSAAPALGSAVPETSGSGVPGDLVKPAVPAGLQIADSHAGTSPAGGLGGAGKPAGETASGRGSGASGPAGVGGASTAGSGAGKPAGETASARGSGASGPAGGSSASSAAGSAAPASNLQPPQEAYVSPVLIAQQGVRMPAELRTILRRPVTVSVRVEVNEAGKVTKAEAVPEKGTHSLLLQAATEAALRCRFKPARRGQTPIASTVTLLFHVDPDK